MYSTSLVAAQRQQPLHALHTDETTSSLKAPHPNGTPAIREWQHITQQANQAAEGKDLIYELISTFERGKKDQLSLT